MGWSEQDPWPRFTTLLLNSHHTSPRPCTPTDATSMGSLTEGSSGARTPKDRCSLQLQALSPTPHARHPPPHPQPSTWSVSVWHKLSPAEHTHTDTGPWEPPSPLRRRSNTKTLMSVPRPLAAGAILRGPQGLPRPELAAIPPSTVSPAVSLDQGRQLPRPAGPSPGSSPLLPDLQLA